MLQSEKKCLLLDLIAIVSSLSSVYTYGMSYHFQI